MPASTALTAPLTLTAAERGITRSASQTLVKSYTNMTGNIRRGINTPAALVAFWATMGALCARNHTASVAGLTAVAAAPNAPGNGIRTASPRKTGAKRTTRTRTAGA